MISLASLWGRRLWPFAALALAGWLWSLVLAHACAPDERTVAVGVAHRATTVAERLVAGTDTLYRRDTIVRRQAIIVYRVTRDTALVHLGPLADTVRVRAAFAAADNALALDSTAIASADRAIRAHVVLESALRTELAAANRLRAPRYQVISTTGMELTSPALVTALEGRVRVTERWAVVGRVEQRWQAGEPVRRYVLASYTF